MFRRLSLRALLSMAFLSVAALVGVAGYYQIRLVHSVDEAFVDLLERDVVQLRALDAIKLYTLQLENEALSHSVDRDPAALQRAKDLAQKIKAAQDSYRLHGHTEGERADEFTIDDIAKSTDRVIEQSLILLNPTLPEPSRAQLESREANLEKTRGALLKDIDNAITLRDKQLAAEKALVQRQVQTTEQNAWLIAALVTCVGLVLGLFIADRIVRMLGRFKVGAQRIANGDFSRPLPVNSRDEVGQLAMTFNQMSLRLKDSYSRLAVEKQRDEAILQSMGEGLIAVDEQANVVLINHIALELLDLPAGARVIGDTIHSFLKLSPQDPKHTSLLPAGQLPPLQTLQSGKPVSDVFGFLRKDKRRLLVHVSANPITFEQRVIGAIVLLRDVTKEKEVDRMKTEFISLASHQLRTPLSAIKWFSEMLLSGDAGKLNPEQEDFTKSIADSTQRMIELVNSLLNISRIESGRIMIDPKPTDLKELVSGIVTDLRAKTEQKQQTLVISVHDDLPQIPLDPRLIGQVYLNLLTNAIKYTPKGGEIAVFISRKGDKIISQVTDNGYGIPKDQQGRVFQKFFRAANAVKVETDGTGLGLYLIKAIVESSGGEIWFESGEGKGTTFWFSIPESGMKAKEGEVTLDV